MPAERCSENMSKQILFVYYHNQLQLKCGYKNIYNVFKKITIQMYYSKILHYEYYCKLYYISAVQCENIPVWKNLVADMMDRHVGTNITYSCIDDYGFTDGDATKYSVCTSHGRWTPEFQDCEGR